jgi:sucrose-phosphate synthase
LYVLHIALGGCLKAPPIRYGLTEDTGGHIGYVLDAARAQLRAGGCRRVGVVTRAFAGAGHDPAHARPRETVAPGLEILRLAGDRRGYLDKGALAAELPALTRDLIALIAREGVLDAIHAHFADAAELALAARARFGCPVVYTPHSLALDKPGAEAREPERVARERRALAEADAVVASSRDECERQVAAYGTSAAGRTWRLTPGCRALAPAGPVARGAALVDLAFAEPERPLLLAVARPVAKKNLAGLVEAFAAVPGLADRANLAILAGQHAAARPGSEAAAVLADLNARVARLGLAGRVALPPAHDGCDVAALYRLAARRGGVFVNPALFEPFGLTTLEAAAAGLPVVVTDRGGPPEILARIGHGAAVDPTDPEAIGRACLEMLEDGALWRARAAAALRWRPGRAWDGWAAASRAVYAHARARRLVPAAAPAAPGVLVSDIDATLTGSRAAAARFAAWHARARMPFVAATGRAAPEARAVLARWGLPQPDVLIASVGTEIYAGPDAALDEGFARRIGRGWDAEAVSAVLAAADARPQAAVEQRRWKRSYLGDAREAARLRARLAEEGLAARVVASHGKLIDVLPARAGKAAAMDWVARGLGLSAADCIACGDSGNDRDMLEAAGRAVVGGGSPELADLAPRAGLHRARAAHADGVLEALAAAPARVLEGRA